MNTQRLTPRSWSMMCFEFHFVFLNRERERKKKRLESEMPPTALLCVKSHVIKPEFRLKTLQSSAKEGQYTPSARMAFGYDSWKFMINLKWRSACFSFSRNSTAVLLRSVLDLMDFSSLQPRQCSQGLSTLPMRSFIGLLSGSLGHEMRWDETRRDENLPSQHNNA